MLLVVAASGAAHAAGTMTTARRAPTATLLLDGTVLVAGGISANGISRLASAEIYDPTTDTFFSVGDMATPRSSHTATVDSGRTLSKSSSDRTM
jgi:hypothetical protein